jgi:hypothetical protein
MTLKSSMHACVCLSKKASDYNVSNPKTLPASQTIRLELTFFNPFIIYKGFGYAIDRNLLYKAAGSASYSPNRCFCL